VRKYAIEQPTIPPPMMMIAFGSELETLIVIVMLRTKYLRSIRRQDIFLWNVEGKD